MITLRPALKRDASDMALLVNIASHRLAAVAWFRSPDFKDMMSPLELGRLRAMRDSGAFIWRNAILAVTQDDVVAGMVTGYREPDRFDDPPSSDVDPMFAPLVELEHEAPGSWYLNVLAVYTPWRRQGVGRRLLASAEERARKAGARRMSLIVENGNTDALGLYAGHGFAEAARRPLIGVPDGPVGDNWLLMIKELG